MNKKVSIIVCTYNEVNHIEQTIKLINENIPQVEIIIIDDNSTDGTLERLDKIKKKYNFHLNVRKDEKGLASAQKKGFLISTGEYIGTLDANSHHQIFYFNKLIEKLDSGSDIAVLSRYVKGGGDERIFIRSFSSRLINIICKIFLRIPFNDFTSGIFLMKRGLLEELKKIISGYCEWFIEFIYILYKKNFKIEEIAYVQKKDDELIQSKSFPNIFKFLYLGSKYFFRIFSTLLRD